MRKLEVINCSGNTKFPPIELADVSRSAIPVTPSSDTFVADGCDCSLAKGYGFSAIVLSS